MSFPRYPTYKPSGVEWLGDVPEHWDVSCLKHSVADIYSGGTPESGNPVYWTDDDEEGIPWVSIGDMTRADLVEWTEKRVTQAGLVSKRLRVLPKGTLLYSMYASLGKVAVLGVDATINQAILGIVPDDRKTAQSFLRFWLIQMENHLGLFSSSNTQDNLNAGKVRALPLLIAPLTEQSAIAGFLDRETSKIDGLVGEQRRLIELLKEKRQAVISQAVTKGLNAGAAMKESGIEWVGQVPVGWACTRNKSVFREVDERSEDANGELLTVSHITGVTRRSEKDVNMFMAETLKGYKKCRTGDLVINTMWAWMGALGCSPLDGLVSPAYNVYRSRESAEILPSYYDYLCRLPSHAIAMKARSTGVWESRLRLYPGAFLDMRMPMPPLEEQAQIVAYLDGHLSRWSGLVTEAERGIELLQERRTALISAAVTGKIDVREIVGNEK